MREGRVFTEFIRRWMGDSLWWLCVRRQMIFTDPPGGHSGGFRLKPQALPPSTFRGLTAGLTSLAGRWEWIIVFIRGGVQRCCHCHCTLKIPQTNPTRTQTHPAPVAVCPFFNSVRPFILGSQHGGNPTKASERRVRPQAQRHPWCLRLRLRWVYSSPPSTPTGVSGCRRGVKGTGGERATVFTC